VVSEGKRAWLNYLAKAQAVAYMGTYMKEKKQGTLSDRAGRMKKGGVWGARARSSTLHEKMC